MLTGYAGDYYGIIGQPGLCFGFGKAEATASALPEKKLTSERTYE
jgi:hypothetical protein